MLLCVITVFMRDPELLDVNMCYYVLSGVIRCWYCYYVVLGIIMCYYVLLDLIHCN